MVRIDDKGAPEADCLGIARVAARLFACKGYDATPVQEIAEAAGVTKPTLYYHFKSKEGLAHALLHEPIGRLVETLRARTEGAADPVEGLVGCVEAHFEFLREDPERFRFFYAVFFGPPGSSLAAELIGCGRRIDEAMLRAAGRMADAEILDRARIDDFVASVRGLIVTRTMDYLYLGIELEPDLARRLVGDLLRGFGTGRPDRDRGRA